MENLVVYLTIVFCSIAYVFAGYFVVDLVKDLFLTFVNRVKGNCAYMGHFIAFLSISTATIFAIIFISYLTIVAFNSYINMYLVQTLNTILVILFQLYLSKD